MDHGHIIFNGDVEEAISLYMGHDSKEYSNRILVNANMRDHLWVNPAVSIEEIQAYSDDGILTYGDQLRFRLRIQNHQSLSRELFIRVMVKTTTGTAVTMAPTADKIIISADRDITVNVLLDTSHLVPGTYSLSFVLYEIGELGMDQNIDVLRDIYSFSILSSQAFNHGMNWNTQWWGHFTVGDLIVLPQDG